MNLAEKRAATSTDIGRFLVWILLRDSVNLDTAISSFRRLLIVGYLGNYCVFCVNNGLCDQIEG